MHAFKQGLTGLLTAFFLLLMVLGGVSLSLAEGRSSAPPPAATSTLALPSIFPDLTIVSPTLPPPSPTMTLPAPSSACPPPAGWQPYTVRAGDTLESIADLYQVSPEALGKANCLVTTTLLPGSLLYLPPRPTRTPIPCGPPPGWIAYIVQSGDTLYRLSRAYGISVAELQRANCLGGSTLIRTGQKLYVPPWATRTPSRTLTPTGPRTWTSTVFTHTPTPTFSATPTPTSTPTASHTPTFTGTFTETPSSTFTPTQP
ncbi:MAG: LysM peptidoglycan-binding domain-containing protein [Anaerolineales bacterium]|nr:LysM peptidoglycan-binding domain-containing protein [Anaerolineales bacterium]MCX7607671.1 LysM peptidoglycan-binding domain-containing protein [Anaerolineales bacterium]